jgi:hypothetical protein
MNPPHGISKSEEMLVDIQIHRQKQSPQRQAPSRQTDSIKSKIKKKGEKGNGSPPKTDQERNSPTAWIPFDGQMGEPFEFSLAPLQQAVPAPSGDAPAPQQPLRNGHPSNVSNGGVSQSKLHH